MHLEHPQSLQMLAIVSISFRQEADAELDLIRDKEILH